MHAHAFIRMRHALLLTVFGVLFVVFAVPAPLAAAIVEPGFEKETVASGFVLPVAMAFAPDGRIFVAEKGGTVRIVKNGALVPEPLITLTDINTFGDRGLLGMAVDPDFATNGHLYLSYTYENTPGANVGGPKTGRIVRVTVEGDRALESSKVVLVGTVGGDATAPSCQNFAVTADCIPSDSLSHSVGGLRFGPDGMLYATLGDGANFDYADILSQRAQNIDSLAGKVLRIRPDGTAPDAGDGLNPFFDGNQNSNRSKVFAYGVRNAFRLNFNPTTGALLLGDVGWSTREEINTIVAGANYGWPCWEGTQLTTHNCTSTNTVPTYDYAHNQFGAGSVTAGAFGTNNAYPDSYDRSFFFGDYAQNWIKRMELDENGQLVAVHDFMDDPDGPVDISTGPDGTIYYLSIYTGDLNRITHTNGNRRPVVTIAANPTSGLAPLAVSFTSAGSYDPDSDALSYAWDFGDGATSTEANPAHTFTTNGTYDVVMTLTDAHGASAAKSVRVTVGNQAPSASITSPATGTLYSPGDVIQLSGVGIDPEEGDLPASAFVWQIVLHHNTHTHLVQEFTNTKTPWFVAPDHSASDVYTEVLLAVTDSTGLASVMSINLYLDNGSGVEGNLIQNPSVEIPADGPGGNPLNWLRGNYGLNNPTFTYPVAGFEGSKALQLSLDYHVDGNAKWYFSPLSVTPGDEYHYTEYYASDVTTSLYAQLGRSNGTYQYVNLATVPPAATPTKLEASIQIPVDVETMTIWHELGTVGTLTTDNFSLVHVSHDVDTTPPSLAITSPAEGAAISGTTTIAVTAGDSGGLAGVTLMIDGADVGAEDTAAPYEFAWDSASIANGVHSISARARDVAGNSATATPVQISVANGSAPVNLIANANLEIQNGAFPESWFQGGWGNHTRSYSYPVTGYNGGKAVRTDITAYPDAPVGSGDAKWAFNKVPVTPGVEYVYSDHYRSNIISDIIGQYTLTDGSFHYFGLAKEIQPTNTWAEISRTFTPPANATHVTFFHLISSIGYVEIDDVALYENGSGTPSETNTPIVEFTNPLNGQTVSGNVTLTASSSDDTAVTYIFYAVNGTPITGQITQAPYAHVWNTTAVPNGTYLLKATTHDPFGNNSTHTISVTVDNSIVPTNNLIANPSFETVGTNGDPEAWLRGGWGTNNRVFTYPVTGTEGAKAARVEITSYTNGDAKWYFADVPVTGGTAYAIDYDMRSNTATEVLARAKRADGSYQYLFLQAVPASTTWSPVHLNVPVPADATHLTLFHVIHSVGYLEMDNFRMPNPSSGGDTIAPSVTLTAPAEAAVASSTITVSADATDNVGVTAVTFFLDGAQVAEDTTAPYSFALDTNTITNGGHTAYAQARDAAGNVGTSTSHAFTVANNSTNTLLTSLIQNPSFEEGSGGMPLHWVAGRWGTNTTVFTYPVAGNHGTSGARIEMTSYTDGDAKWRHEDVPVTPGEIYTFTHDYRSNVVTNITARYTLANGTYQYVSLGNFPATANWTSITQTFVAPANATSVTIFHIMNKVGWLEVDAYSLLGGNQNEFSNGMITLTFDDGWISQYTKALPILDAANVKAGFYITSQETLDAVPQETVHNPSLEIIDFADEGYPERWHPGGWGTNTRTFSYPVAGEHDASGARVEITSYESGDAKWWFEDVAIIPGQTYRFEDSYQSNVTTEAVLRITRADDSVYYRYIGAVPSSNGEWQRFSAEIEIPDDARLVSMFHILGSVGYLTIDNMSVKRVQEFVDVSQMLAMQAAGHEIGSHTRTHANLPTLAPAEEELEIVGSRNELLGAGITTVDTFVYPFGAFDDDTRSLVQSAGYVAARGVERGYNTRATDKLALKIQSMNRTTTLAEVQNWIAQAALDKTWLILMFHQIDEPEAELGISAQMLTDTLDAIATSGIEVVNMREGVSRMNPSNQSSGATSTSVQVVKVGETFTHNPNEISASSTAEFKITLRVTNHGSENVYVPLNTLASLNAGGNNSRGVSYAIVGTSGAPTTTGASATLVHVSGGTELANSVRISGGASADLQLIVVFNPAAPENTNQWRVQMWNVGTAATDSALATSIIPTVPIENFRSNYYTINN